MSYAALKIPADFCQGARTPTPRPLPNRRLRVARWVIGNPPDMVHCLWKGNEHRLVSGQDPEFDACEGMTNGDALPLIYPRAGSIVEFQELVEGEWMPCPDPRKGLHPAPFRVPAANVSIIDADHSFWVPYRNFIGLPRWKRTLLRSSREAHIHFGQSGLGFSTDVVVVGVTADASIGCALVRELRQKGFRGRVFAFAETEDKARLIDAGCNSVFRRAEMKQFILALYGV